MNRIRRWNTAWLFVGVAVVSYVAALSAAQSQLPPGEGKELVEQVCASSCHGAENWSGLRLDKESWAPIVKDMSERAEARTDKELELMVNYLAKNFGVEPAATDKTDKVNINKATVKELQTTLSLSEKESDAIVEYREKNGNFKSWDDLKNVPDLDAKKLEEKKDRITFSN